MTLPLIIAASLFAALPVWRSDDWPVVQESDVHMVVVSPRDYPELGYRTGDHRTILKGFGMRSSIRIRGNAASGSQTYHEIYSYRLAPDGMRYGERLIERTR